MVDYQPKTSLRNLPLLLQKVSVLVIDSDQRIANIVKHVLQNLGFGTIRLEHTSQEGLDYMMQTQVDFLICDQEMERLDNGQTLVKFLRTNPESPNAYVPIIMMSAHTDAKHVAEARDQGITEFAAKPFTAKTLCDRVVSVIENPRSFILAPEFKGPNRRRKKLPTSKERRKKT